MKKTIRVKGKGSISVKPDIIVLTLELTGSGLDYAALMKESSRRTDDLKQCFEDCGIPRSDVKTASFNINTKYESVHDGNGMWKQEFAGYEYNHELKVEFEADNELLESVLSAIAAADVKPIFSIGYSVKDKEKVKNKLLARAVADSRSKAEILTMAAGVDLGDIISIQYSWGEMDMCVTPIRRYCADGAYANAKLESIGMDLQPEDIKVSDTVTLIWKIER